MKILQTLLILVISLISCKTSNRTVIEAQVNQGLDTGKCYFSIIQNSNTNTKEEKAFILELVPPEYEEIEAFYSNEQLENFAIENNKYRLLVREAHSQFVLKNEDLSKFTKVKNPTGFLYCLVEVSSEYKMFSKENLAEINNKIIQKKVASNSKIVRKYVSQRPEKLLNNQYYFEKGKWSKLQQAVASSY